MPIIQILSAHDKSFFVSIKNLKPPVQPFKLTIRRDLVVIIYILIVFKKVVCLSDSYMLHIAYTRVTYINWIPSAAAQFTTDQH